MLRKRHEMRERAKQEEGARERISSRAVIKVVTFFCETYPELNNRLNSWKINL